MYLIENKCGKNFLGLERVSGIRQMCRVSTRNLFITRVAWRYFKNNSFFAVADCRDKASNFINIKNRML
jgi:hypothetical protein